MSTRRARRFWQDWRLWLASGLLLLFVPAVSLLPHMMSGTELARVRNALVIDDDLAAVPHWAPPDWPDDFLLETVPADPYFVDIANRLQLAALDDDWARSLAISAHLLGSAPVLYGGPVQKPLIETHRAITERGDGYCVDFVRAFVAIAQAASMQLRTWAFSFDGFGGRGHIWVEVWNRQRTRWQLLDIYNNYYFVEGGSAEPLSAAQLREALLRNSPTLALKPLHAAARPGYAIEAKAWDYFRRGLPGWYLWSGVNFQSGESQPLVRSLAKVSRSLSQLAGIATGVQPRIHMLADPANRVQRENMRQLRLRVLAGAAAALAGVLVLLGAVMLRRRSRPSPQE